MKMKIKDNSVILCCRQKNCPSMKIVENAIEITFDDGTIPPLLSFEQVEMIPQALETLRQMERIKAKHDAIAGQ